MVLKQQKMNFSIVVPLRDTPKERNFASKSIPSAVRLKPNEIIVGMDRPVAKSTMKYVEEIFEKLSFRNYTILQVPRSAEWNFQLANVIWHCYKACKNDKILTYNIDSILRSNILDGYYIVGKNETAVVSFTHKLLVKNVSGWIKYAFYRYRVHGRTHVFTGNYWIWRPYYFEDVDLEGFKKIQNGMDTYMYKGIVDRGRHNVVTRKDVGTNSLDIQNEDIPWRQFQDGIWLYAHPEVIGAYRGEFLRGSTGSGKTLQSLNRVIPFTVLACTVGYQHIWMLRGWRWAKSHKNHEVVQMASELSIQEWIFTGAKHVKEIYDWQRQGKTGTGFG